jgi:ribonuclease HI
MTNEQTNGHIYVLATDGACRFNPGPGGWGVIVHELSGDTIVSRYALAGRADEDTTNNRMELTAAIEGLRSLPESHPARVLSDSQYVVNGVSLWLPRWKANGWRKSDRKPVENVDLWQTLDELLSLRPISWEWVRGHAGHPMNTDADMLANGAAVGFHRGDPAELKSRYRHLFD